MSTDTSPTTKITIINGQVFGPYPQVVLTHLLALDGDDTGLSEDNTERVEEACVAQIQAFVEALQNSDN